MNRDELKYFQQTLLKILIGVMVFLLFAGISLIQDASIKLNTSNTNSSFLITDSNDATLLKVRADKNVGIRENNPATAVDVNGTITAKQYIGDGSQLSNVLPIANYSGGNLLFQLSTTDRIVKTVNLTVPAEGYIKVMATGYTRWESKVTDEAQFSITTSTSLDQDYLMYLTDYGCTDSSDQYASFGLERGYLAASSGTYTFNLIASMPHDTNKVRVDDVNLSAIYFPSGYVTVANPQILTVIGNKNEEADKPKNLSR